MLKYAVNTRGVIFFHLDLRTTATSVIEIYRKFLEYPALQFRNYALQISKYGQSIDTKYYANYNDYEILDRGISSTKEN